MRSGTTPTSAVAAATGAEAAHVFLAKKELLRTIMTVGEDGAAVSTATRRHDSESERGVDEEGCARDDGAGVVRISVVALAEDSAEMHSLRGDPALFSVSE